MRSQADITFLTPGKRNDSFRRMGRTRDLRKVLGCSGIGNLASGILIGVNRHNLRTSLISELIPPHWRRIRKRPGPQGHPPAPGHILSPLVREPPRVLLEQRRGVDAVASEGPAAEVVDEQVLGHGQLEAGPPCPLGDVVIIEEADAEPPPLMSQAPQRCTI
jgi:hypothetical protein